MEKATIPIFHGYSPSANLPNDAVDGAEGQFVQKFAQVYQEMFPRIHRRSEKKEMCLVREIPVSGLGIADLVAVNWSRDVRCRPEAGEGFLPEQVAMLSPTVRAFEVKMSEWKKGLMQAHRYSYFSNASILVLPVKKAYLASDYIETFQRLSVGLWAFDQESMRIVPLYTPRPSTPSCADHWEVALNRALNTYSDFCSISE